MRTISLLLFVLAAALAAPAADRVIGYVQQEKPGELVIVSVVQTEKKSVVTVRDFRTGGGESRHAMAVKEFEEMWRVLNGSDAAAYVFEPKGSESMSDPEFYTVSLVSGSKRASLRIPRDSPAPLSEVVTKIKVLIEKRN